MPVRGGHQPVRRGARPHPPGARPAAPRRRGRGDGRPPARRRPRRPAGGRPRNLGVLATSVVDSGCGQERGLARR
ncbi:MAG: hypothetical protein GEV07_18210 [Streptosporangiales bacterium]|nr:hypothetical protein [Streptosporangiales bacterium]